MKQSSHRQSKFSLFATASLVSLLSCAAPQHQEYSVSDSSHTHSTSTTDSLESILRNVYQIHTTSEYSLPGLEPTPFTIPIQHKGSTLYLGQDSTAHAYFLTASHVATGPNTHPHNPALTRSNAHSTISHLGSDIPLRIFSLDESHDLAILKSESPTLNLGNGWLNTCHHENNSALPLGQRIYSLGFPAPHFQPTITSGIISINPAESNSTHYYIDAEINPGCSGGPVITYDNHGKAYLVGINSTAYRGMIQGTSGIIRPTHIHSILQNLPTEMRN